MCEQETVGQRRPVRLTRGGQSDHAQIRGDITACRRMRETLYTPDVIFRVERFDVQNTACETPPT